MGAMDATVMGDALHIGSVQGRWKWGRIFLFFYCYVFMVYLLIYTFIRFNANAMNFLLFSIVFNENKTRTSLTISFAMHSIGKQ